MAIESLPAGGFLGTANELAQGFVCAETADFGHRRRGERSRIHKHRFTQKEYFRRLAKTKLLLGLLINFGPSKVEFKRLLF